MISPLRSRTLLFALLLASCGTSVKPEGAPGLALTIGAGQLDMNVGELAQLQAIPADGAGQPYTGLFTLSWSSSSPAIAAVSSTGQLSAVSAGTAVISAQATRVDTGAIASASVTLTVRAPPTQDTTPPSTPSGLSATSASATAVNLAWSASSDNVGVTGYRVLRGGAQIATVTTTNYADAGLSPATNYRYSVIAFDAAGNLSPASAEVGVMTAAQPPPPTGLIAAYGFSQGSGATLSDSSGNGRVGTLVGGPSWGAGRNGGGLSFNGGGAYVTMVDVNALDGLTRLTVSAWIRTTASGEKHIVDKSGCDGAASGGPFELGTSFFVEGKATFIVYRAGAGNTFEKVDSTTTVTDGAWHHIAGVYDGSNVLIYVDGALRGTTPAAGITLPATGNALELGGRCNGNAYPWNGSVDDVRLYSRALSAAEIGADMNAAVMDSVGGGGTDAGSALQDAGSAAPDAGSAAPDAGSAAPDAGSAAPDVGTPAGALSFDFTTLALQNPLSVGGIWSNNTQGIGGNVAPGNLTNMEIALASDGVTHIAIDTHGGIEYDDSFAFVPGFSGDQYIEAVIYKEPGYDANAAGSNHELELILGCSSASGTRIWNEFLFNSGGGVDIMYLDGGPSDFVNLGNVGGPASGRIPVDGDVVRATRVGDVLSLYLNGVLWVGYDGSNPARVARGSGIGIAGFIRPGATHNKYGFRRVTMGRL